MNDIHNVSGELHDAIKWLDDVTEFKFIELNMFMKQTIFNKRMKKLGIEPSKAQNKLQNNGYKSIMVFQ